MEFDGDWIDPLEEETGFRGVARLGAEIGKTVGTGAVGIVAFALVVAVPVGLAWALVSAIRYLWEHPLF
ncbi:MAG TPA: hypothetical protein VEA41_01840 [Salinarimonas sp.]|nr:hypothetical protein [Salinarimonas sp.]